MDSRFRVNSVSRANRTGRADHIVQPFSRPILQETLLPMSAPTNCPSSDLDPWGEDALRNPYPMYEQLRQLGPIVWLPQHQAYCVTQYAEARSVLQDWGTFSSASGVGLCPEINAASGRGILTTDPPLHDTRRKVLSKQLSGRALKPHTPFVSEEAYQLVNTLTNSGSFDAVSELARPYSVKVVADLVGLPDEGREHLVDRATDAFNTFGPSGPSLDASMPGFKSLIDYAMQDAALPNLAPGGWGEEIYAAGESGAIEPEACPGLMLAYVWAGMDTTVNAIASAVWLFAQNPDQWDLVVADPSLIPSAFNEVLRMEPPVQRFTRCVTAPTTKSGIDLPAGARVAVLFGSANRDKNHYDDPDTFDVTRNPTDHLSFGRGVHRCVGAPLALLESHAILSAFAARVKKFTVEEAEWRANFALHGLDKLQVSVSLI